MAVADQFIKKKTTTSSAPVGAGVSSRFIKSSSTNTATLDLQSLAQQAGVQLPTQRPRLSFLGRLGAGLGAFETGEALATGLEKKSLGAGVLSYAKGVAKGLGSAITGRDFGQTQKRSYKDILEKAGVENKVAKFGLGFIGDVLLDPTTYFGGAIAKGVLKGGKIATSGALKTAGKVSPKLELGIRLAGKGVEEAFGKAFKYGYGTSRGLADKALEIQSQVAKAKEGIVFSNIKRLGTGTLSKSQQEELVAKLLSGKRAELAGKSADEAVSLAKSSDPVVQKVIGAQMTRSAKFAGLAGVDDPYTVYFPGIAKDKISRFLEGTRTLRVGNEGYLKQFKDLLKDDELVRNPAEAFARREFEIAKDSIMRSQLNAITKQFGKGTDAFKNADEALKAGYLPIKEKGMFGKVVGYLPETDKKFLDNLITPEFTTIDAIAKSFGFDAITSLFKRSVTGLFVPFHVRNFVSGNIQNYEVLGARALDPRNFAIGQRIAYALAKGKSFGDDSLDIAGKQYRLNSIMEPFAKRFGTSSQYISDIGDATAGKAITKVTSKNPLSADHLVFRKARAIGNYIETQQKATAYITALRSGRNVQEALTLATAAGFDYRALTQFESKVLRRLIPFYSFTRKNIELQLRTLGEHPERINNILKLADNLSGGLSSEERDMLPDYAKEQFVTKFGEKVPGLPEIAVGFGTPIEQIGQVFGSNSLRRIAAMLNPVFKVPLERSFNKDFFRDRPLDEVVEAGEYAKAPQFIKDFLKATPVEKKNKDGSTRIVYNADPKRLQLLRNLPTTRGATYVSAIFSDTTNKAKVLNSLTGVKPKPIDLETVEYFRNRDNQRELEDLLIRAGVLKRFEKTYVPKD